MNKLNTSFYLFLLAFVPFLYSCEDETPEPPLTDEGIYRDGVLVVNQGAFQGEDGSLDFYVPESGTLQRNVYRAANGEPIGGNIEDVAFHQDQAYIVVNKTDKILVAGADNLQHIASIEDEALITPRYFTASANKGYVSVWGPYEEDFSLQNSKVAVLDLNNNTVLTTIPVPAGPEGIVAIDGKVFVANSFTDTISVIDSNTDELIHKIKLESSPKHFVVDENEMLWVATGNSLLQINPETYAILQTVELPNQSLSGKIQLVENTLYFHTSEWNADNTTSNALYKIDISAASPAAELVLEKDNLQTFGVDPAGGNIYAAVAVGAAPGTVLVLDEEGNELENFAANLFPYEIIFR